MTGGWIRFLAAAGLLLLGLFFEVLAVFGANRFKKALNRIHAAAMGDTLGILFVSLGLMVMRGFSMDSLKLFLVILFFWLASPVSGHMIARLEAMTNQNLGEIAVIRMEKEDREKAAGSGRPGGGDESLPDAAETGPEEKGKSGSGKGRKGAEK